MVATDTFAQSYWRAFRTYVHDHPWTSNHKLPPISKKHTIHDYETGVEGLLYQAAFELPDGPDSHPCIWFSYTIQTGCVKDHHLQDVLFQAIVRHKEDIEADLGEQPEWSNDGEWGYKIKMTLCADPRDAKDWVRQFAWLSDQMDRYTKAFASRIQKMVNDVEIPGLA
ncbi:MAG: DUF4268 domain-containing protein [Armatimonadota bacterium]